MTFKKFFFIVKALFKACLKSGGEVMEDRVLHQDNIKEQNIRQIRNILRQQKEMKIADIAKQTGLSYPTVSKLIKELTEKKIVMQCKEKASCGGRPGAKFFIPDFPPLHGIPQ